jgi:hypothetical protein
MPKVPSNEGKGILSTFLMHLNASVLTGPLVQRNKAVSPVCPGIEKRKGHNPCALPEGELGRC